ncbi:regulator of G-protein signaling 20-like isoform X2 [Ornithodoros turicata]|uniref:regulator of G-protein signaling 20-like isoform X2 n=1 Tax=Ornithodoros turicata TaxID=34597 RepID=UPI003139EE44
MTDIQCKRRSAFGVGGLLDDRRRSDVPRLVYVSRYSACAPKRTPCYCFIAEPRRYSAPSGEAKLMSNKQWLPSLEKSEQPQPSSVVVSPNNSNLHQTTAPPPPPPPQSSPPDGHSPNANGGSHHPQHTSNGFTTRSAPNAASNVIADASPGRPPPATGSSPAGSRHSSSSGPSPGPSQAGVGEVRRDSMLLMLEGRQQRQPSTPTAPVASPTAAASSPVVRTSQGSGAPGSPQEGSTAPSTEGHGKHDKDSKTCCFCWCCCCSCSCLAVKSNNGNVRSARENNQKLTSGDNFLNGDGDALPTVEEIRSWGDSFEKLMKCSAGRKVFRDFLKCEYSEENILFWLACEDLKKESNPDVIEEKARMIYEDYISILSPREVSLDSRVREIINRNMVAPTAHTFDEAQLQIYTLMHRDSYPRFVNSPLYRKMAQLPSPSRKGSAA